MYLIVTIKIDVFVFKPAHPRPITFIQKKYQGGEGSSIHSFGKCRETNWYFSEFSFLATQTCHKTNFYLIVSNPIHR